MTKLILQQGITIVKNDIVVGDLPNVNKNDVLIYNKKQTEKKLKDINSSNKDELTEITKVIAQWGYALGITVIAQDLVTLNNFIRENFQNLNIFDLKACVKLVSVNSDLLETDAEHYGKLSFIYVSKVLKAYERYRSTACFNVRDKIFKLEQENKPPISKNERLENFKQLLTDAKEITIKGEVYQDLGEVIYNFIRYNKIIKIDKSLIDMAMEYGEKSFRNSMSDVKKGDLKKLVNDVSFTKMKKEDMIKREARKYVANHWVKEMDLNNMLKKLTYEMLLY